MTGFGYGAPVVDRQHNVVSGHNGWIAHVYYPDPATGQPGAAASLSFTYYADGGVASRTDAEGNSFEYDYDELGQQVETRITPDTYHQATNPIRSIEYAYTPDGLLELVTARAADDTILLENKFEYDDLRHLTKEHQSHAGAVVAGTTPVVNYSWEFSPAGTHNFDRLTTITYPTRPQDDDSRTITLHYGNGTTDPDSALSRVTRINDSELGDVAQYAYAGTGRRVQTTLGNNVNQSVAGDGGYPGLDRWGRLIDLHFKNGTDTVHRYQYGYDKAGNRLFARVTQSPTNGGSTPHDNDRSYLYAYDGLNRLIDAHLGKLKANNDAIESDPAVALARQTTWSLDNLGNFSGGTAAEGSLVSRDDTDGDGLYGDADDPPEAGLKIHHPVNLTNEITQVVTGGTPGPDLVYDQNGNLVYDGQHVYRYDAWNRLIDVHLPGTATFDDTGRIDGGTLGDLVATYHYGPLGRLIACDADSQTEHYYYDGVRRIQQVLDHPDPQQDETQHE